MTMRRDCEGPTFGISLTLLCERSGVEVPHILGDILRWLAAHALAQPDVFAETPRSAITSRLKSAIDTGASLSELVVGTHPAVVGSLLKRWLEELPDPLLNWDQQVELLSACKDEGCIEARIASLNDAVALVDHIALGTLKPLLLFLQQYCFRQRRFDQQLLQVAVAFAPILFPAALAAGPTELRLAEETVATLVSNALHVFNPTLAANVPVVTPQALCEAAAEIMESQQEQEQQQEQQAAASDDCQGYGGAEHAAAAAVSSPHHHHHCRNPGFGPSIEGSLLAEQDEQLSALPTGAEAGDEPQYEPYLQDEPFLASLDEMVGSCVKSALFSFFGVDGDDDAADVPGAAGCGWGAEDDCGSIHSSCSNINISGGGAASSSGGASSCSASSALSHGDQIIHHNHQFCGQQQPQHQRPNNNSHSHHQHLHHHHHHQQHNSHQSTCRRGALENHQQQPADAPYSPHMELVVPLETGDPVRSSVEAAAPASVIAFKTSSALMPASHTALAELAQREVAEGSVFCIISAGAAGGTTASLTLTTTAAGEDINGNAVSNVKKADAAVAVPDFVMAHHHRHHHQQLRQPAPVADAADLQPDPLSTSRSVSGRRSTEGGAASVTATATSSEAFSATSQAHGRAVVAASTGHPQLQGSGGEPRLRRMTLGGDHDGHRSTTAQPQSQSQLQPTTPASVGSAVAALYEHLPQLRSRTGASSSPASGIGSGVPSNSPQHSDREARQMLPPPAATSPSSGSGGGCIIAELGVAGHLRVTLTSGLTLLVRELATPEALVHRMPIRSMTAAAMQGEKERLKRQLKDVAAAYEALAGRPLTQALKEPLRPVYVRYHKIKALLNSGKAAGPGASIRGGGGGAQLLQPRPSVAPVVVPSRQSVVA